MSVTQIPTRPGMGRSLIDHDPRNRNFPARGVMFDPAAPIRSRTWRRGYPYDQGATSQCVAYTAKGLFNTAPLSAGLSYYTRSKIVPEIWYEGAQDFDEWEGSEYDGTSARGILRYLTSVGKIHEYRWCFGLDDVLKTVSNYGPVSVGSWWRADMWGTNEQGLVPYSGEYAGGHQWELIGVDESREEIIAMNSWGRSWGTNGRFKMKFAEFEKLLEDDADAHTVVTL